MDNMYTEKNLSLLNWNWRTKSNATYQSKYLRVFYQEVNSWPLKQSSDPPNDLQITVSVCGNSKMEETVYW